MVSKCLLSSLTVNFELILIEKNNNIVCVFMKDGTTIKKTLENCCCHCVSYIFQMMSFVQCVQVFDRCNVQISILF